MRWICDVDVASAASALHLLPWLPSTDGYAMLENWPAGFPAQALLDAVAEHYPGHRRGMTCLSALVPGQFIEPHRDKHDGYCRKRIHVPIVTNPSCVFVSGKQAMHMKAGHVWEIDPTEVHCTANGGETERVHLFFNMVEQ